MRSALVYVLYAARACGVSSPGERKLNMPDSISQSTATVLRINGREMSYCAIFVRDLCARPSPHPSPLCTLYATSLLHAKRERNVSFIPSLARDVSGECSHERVLPTLRPRFYSSSFSLSLFFPPYNVDCIGTAFFRPMLIDFLSHVAINKRDTYGKIDLVNLPEEFLLEENRERISLRLTI